jgi:hypothetical protein
MNMPTLSWIKQVGTTAFDSASSIAVDQWGNIFVSGRTDGEFASGQAKGSSYAFLAKYTAAGEQEWVKQVGTASNDSANSIAVDQSGHILVSGFTFGELASGQAKGQGDAFLAKYIDDLTTTQHHMLVMKRFDTLSKEIAAIKSELYSQNNDLSLIGLANEFKAGVKKNKISTSEAKKIIKKAQGADKTISESGKKTLALIYSKYPTTNKAAELILNSILKK